jgi:hypothetical protein
MKSRNVWWAALVGLGLSLVAFALEIANDGGSDLSMWLNSSPGEGIGYLAGRLLTAPIIFALLALIYNAWIGTKEHRSGTVVPEHRTRDGIAARQTSGNVMSGSTSAKQPAAEEEGPPGEAEAVTKIKHLCWMAAMSAENVALDKRSGHLREDWNEYEHARYQKLRAEALRLADTLTDEFYRSAAIHFLVEACMKADDVDDARASLSTARWISSENR